MSYLDDREREIAKAHERRMASRARFIEGNPNAVSPQERASVMQWQHNQGLTGRESALQQHEMNMLKQRGAIDLGVAEQKRLGMKEQGSDAAEANGRLGLEIEKQRGGSALSLEEKKIAGQKEIAEIDAGVKKHEIDTRHKGILDTNDANVEIEEMRGKTAAEIARENREAAAAEAEKRRQEGAQATANKNAQAQEERIRKTMQDLRNQPGGNKLSDDELRSKAMTQLGITGNGSSWRNLGW